MCGRSTLSRDMLFPLLPLLGLQAAWRWLLSESGQGQDRGD